MINFKLVEMSLIDVIGIVLLLIELNVERTGRSAARRWTDITLQLTSSTLRKKVTPKAEKV